MSVEISDMNMVIAVSGLVICIIGLVQVIISRYIEKYTRKFFIGLFSIMTGYVLFNFLGQATDGHIGRSFAVFSRFTLFNESLFSSVLTVLITGFLLYQCGDDKWRFNKFFYTSLLLWVIYVVLLLWTQFTGYLYYIDDDNVYHRGTFYPLLLIPPVLSMVVSLLALFKYKGKLSSKQAIAFFVYMFIPMLCMLIQMRFYGLYIIVLGTVFSALFMLNYVLTDQTEQYYIQQAENERLKIDILLAQIQPHFLYNSLTTIKHLYSKDPVKADKAIDDFTTYLRHNMDSIAINQPIPFEKELTHVKEYLALQKLRFEDELKVEYDLECMDFLLPTLTLQPLVENAVSYGVRKSTTGCGVVSIRTRRYEDRIEVSVIDDGPGFVYESLANERERSHTGLKNVRERLKRVCNGRLVIDSMAGIGTTVTIVLPQK